MLRRKRWLHLLCVPRFWCALDYVSFVGEERGGCTCLPLIILVSTAREEPWYNHSILVLELGRAQPGQEIWAVIPESSEMPPSVAKSAC